MILFIKELDMNGHKRSHLNELISDLYSRYFQCFLLFRLYSHVTANNNDILEHFHIHIFHKIQKFIYFF